MPKIIQPLNGMEDFDNFSINSAKYKELVKLFNKEIYKRFDDEHIVYRAGNKFFCLDYEKKKVTYYMEYSTSHNSILGSFLWQSLIWRAKNNLSNRTLPHEIFFKVLLPKYGVITTDGEQTIDGRKFWEYQIGFALDNDFYVYYFNLKSKELIKITNSTHGNKVIQEQDVWGLSHEHKSKLIVISTKEL
jgi:hypothetical protein